MKVFEQHYNKKWNVDVSEADLLQHPNVKNVEVYEKGAVITAIAKGKTALVWINNDGTIDSITKGDPTEEWQN